MYDDVFCVFWVLLSSVKKNEKEIDVGRVKGNRNRAFFYIHAAVLMNRVKTKMCVPHKARTTRPQQLHKRNNILSVSSA